MPIEQEEYQNIHLKLLHKITTFNLKKTFQNVLQNRVFFWKVALANMFFSQQSINQSTNYPEANSKIQSPRNFFRIRKMFHSFWLKYEDKTLRSKRKWKVFAQWEQLEFILAWEHQIIEREI